MTVFEIGIAVCFFYIVFSSCCLVLFIIAWKNEKRRIPKAFKVIVDLDKLKVHAPEGVIIDCFKDPRRNRIHLIVHEDSKWKK